MGVRLNFWDGCPVKFSTRELQVFKKVISQLDTWIKSGKSQYFESKYRKV